ncbi:Hpt domain-containing protein [Pseudoxanthomonas sp.]|uniref:hybrid sensor histidine kinase/response regulator n=1 Tax=Pseudoxanthomonas sp. TaxID=1871049 RepID=UPI002589B735|nr:Hpt domain-containing protein [Pseudoxanthomonas sp.]MCR6686286.1 Hpt domain-containing protein [Pseudoxanthomonas sp.]
MSALRDAMSHAVLGWVKPELDETLRQARGEIEAFVENPADSSRMRFCAGYLHQVQGTLRMVELYAPAMVAEEMELLAQALQQGAANDRDEACATLMRGTVLLPDYLERLQNGHRDIPIVLLPLLNDIRAARGAAGLSESVLFAPDLNRPLPEQVPDASPLPWTQRQDQVASAQSRFEDALAGWPEHGAPSDPAALAAAAAALLENARHDSTRRMLWVLSSAAEALRDGALTAGEGLRGAFTGIARAVRQAHEDESLPANAQGVASQEPTRQLLYLVAQARGTHPALDALRQAFDLDAHAPTEAELDHARGSLAGRNRDLLNTVGSVVKEELLRVKDALDLHLRTGGDAAALQPQAEELTKVGDTLGMLGLGVARDVVQQQRDTLAAIARGEQPASESALLDIAGALLYVDASLDDQVARLGAGGESGEDAAAAEARRTVEVLAHEAIANFAAAREHFVAFIETNWDHARLDEVPRLLEEVSGALGMLDLPQPAAYLEGVRRYIATELLERRRVPSGRQLDTLADAMASLEYYLEALRDRRPNREEILEIARTSLENLHYWPLPQAAAPGEEAAPAAEPAVAEAPVAAADIAVEAPPAIDGLAWDAVQVERPQTFAAIEDEYATIPPVELAQADLPEPETLEAQAPALEIEPFVIEPAAPSVPPPSDFHFSFDPVSAEYVASPGATPEAGEILPVELEGAGALPPAAIAPAFQDDATIDGLAWTAPGNEMAAEPVAVQHESAVAAANDASELEQALEAEAEAAAIEDVAGLSAEAPAADADGAAVPQVRGTDASQWLDVNLRLQPETRPVTVFESRVSRIELDGDSSSLIAEISASAAGLPSGGFGTPAVPSAPVAPAAEAATPAVDAAAGPVAGGFDESQDIDADIREVFLEEFEEEMGNLARLLPEWRMAPNDLERMRPIRRVFHTLKGSGRLVGARALGEFSWKIESMLNRVLDGTRPASPAVLATVQQACDVLPQFDAALRGRVPLAADLAGMEAVAERVAAGEEAFYSAPDGVAAEPEMVAAAAAVEAVAEAAPAAASLEEGTPASVDSVLREILEAEVASHLETVDAWIAAARALPQPATDGLLRAMHTMNGAFAMTDVPEITSVTDPAETFIKRSLAGAQVADAEAVDAIAATAEAIRGCIVALQAESPRIPVYTALAARLQALAASLPEASWPQTVLTDEELDDVAGQDAAAGEELTGVEDLTPYLSPELHDAPAPAADTVAVEAAAEDATLEDMTSYEPAVDADAEPASPSEAELEPATVEAMEAAATEDASTTAEALQLEPAEEEPAEEDLAEEGLAEEERADLDATDLADAGDASIALEETADPAVAGEDESLEAAVAGEAAIPAFQSAPQLAEAGAGDGPMLDFAELDRELVDIFVEEGVDLLDHIDGLIQELREDTHAREPIAGLQRDLHTLKGGARMAGIATIGDLGHVIESLLEAAAEQRTELRSGDVQLLERGFDTLHRLLQRTRAHRVTEMPQALIDEFEARIRGQAYAPSADGSAEAYVAALTTPATVAAPAVEEGEAQAAAADDVAATDEASGSTVAADEVGSVAAPVDQAFAADEAGFEPATTPETDRLPSAAEDAVPQPAVPASAAPIALAAAAAHLAPLSPPVEDEPVELNEEGVPRGPQEQVRVRADLLDNLVNHAGEVAIYRSRLEQQLGAFRSAMAELDRTNARLRDQLRRLDLETEAQIVARYQREQDSADPTFDPLELDRFSTLQQLSRGLGESAADLTGLQGVLDDLARQYDVLLQQQSRVSSELQDGLMSARMVPFDSVVPRLRRVVRQAGHETRKQVQLKLDGTHGELDRNVLDRMVAPLEHMLRNSVAHGLELPKDRRDAGKPEEGTITIALRHEGSEIVLRVSDDGRGLDRDAIRRRAESRGLLRADAVLTDAELDSLIFESGFSTSESVSQLAGRGVGMDVVRNEVRQLGGTVEIDSTAGQGVVFTLRLPQTLAVTQAVFVQTGDTTYAVPVASVSGIGRISRERFEAGGGVYRYAGEEYALHDLGLLVGQGPAKAEGQPQVPLLLVRAGDLRAAVAIDQVVGNREIVVKPVGLQIASVPGIYGATITGDGRVVVILDVAPLVRRHLAQPERPVAEVETLQQRRVPLVMVVDDSLTMRKVTGRVLERHNFEVATARDGVEALERLEERVPDLMLLDIEMPRMDGYELATAMRADARFRGVPIVMITSRTGEKHRQRAFEIGVQRYLGKPYQELDLMRNVYDLLGIARVRE